MAGIAALMNKKKRDRMRKEQNQANEVSFGELAGSKEGLQMAEAKRSILKKAIQESFKANMPKQHKEEDDEGIFNNSLAQANSAVYIGLVLIGIGLVISFVGLGDKGFKTTELKLIGPVLISIGSACVVFKILQCHCPILRNRMFKGGKLRDTSEQRSTGIEAPNNDNLNGSIPSRSLQGKNGSLFSSSDLLSPRITLQSSKSNRPHSSTRQSCIDESSDDDFDEGARPVSSESVISNELPKTLGFHAREHSMRKQRKKMMKLRHEREDEELDEEIREINRIEQRELVMASNELLLNPKTLMI